MSKKNPANIAASIQRKVLNVIRNTGDDPNVVWSRFAVERLLYRLSVSEYAGDFMLKGAMLFSVWSGELHRPTVDMDLLGYGEDSGERIADVFRRVCEVDVEQDGLTFDTGSIRVSPIREGQEYHGQRVNLLARIGKARIPVQVDIGFGDAVTPKAVKIEYPTLIDLPAPHIRAYPKETVIAEKFQAMVMLGIGNSRMKDFYDLHVLSSLFAFDGHTLTKAIKATFKRRKTDIPADVPLALTDEFAEDGTKKVQWNAFIRKNGLTQKVNGLSEVLSDLRRFLLPPMKAASGQGKVPVSWKAGGPWSN